MSARLALQQEYNKLVALHQQTQTEIEKNHDTRQKVLSQLNENEMVKKELELLEDDASVFKMVGPILVKQDLVEARSNVGNRLEFINKEVARLDGALKALQGKQRGHEEEMARVEKRMQATTQ